MIQIASQKKSTTLQARPWLPNISTGVWSTFHNTWTFSVRSAIANRTIKLNRLRDFFFFLHFQNRASCSVCVYIYIYMCVCVCERPTRCTLYYLHLFQLYYPLHVSNKQVHHQEVTSVHAHTVLFIHVYDVQSLTHYHNVMIMC